MIFFCFISFVILLRIGELLLSKTNEKWLLLNNAVEYGRGHYKFMVLLHVLFICSAIIEFICSNPVSYSPFLLVLYFLLLSFKVWIIYSLGKFWNTRIYRIPNFPLVKRGPYKFVKHPNYIVVFAEIAVIPLIFNLYFTATIFTLLNAMMLFVRIREENRALNL